MRGIIRVLPYFSYGLALVLGVAMWRWSTPEFTTALILSIVMWHVGQSLQLRTAMNDLEEKADRMQPLARIEEKALQWGRKDAVIERRYREISRELRELSEGNYYIHTIQEVYRDDIRHIENLKYGEMLRSSCPISTRSASAFEQIKDPNYVNSMAAHARASDRGVEVRRLYIFRDPSKITPRIREHLEDIPQASHEIRVVFRVDLEEADIDYVVFGDHTVSVGTVHGDTGMCIGTRVTRDKNDVKDAITKFDNVWGVGTRVQDLPTPRARRLNGPS